MEGTIKPNKNETTFEIEYHGNVVHGLPVMVFRFLLNFESKRTKIYRYEWINPPTSLKAVLSPNQLIIRSKTELNRLELLQCLEDMYEVYHEERQEKEARDREKGMRRKGSKNLRREK